MVRCGCMQTTTLLTIFIGMVAVAWFLMALVVAAIGWQIYKILTEVRRGVDRMREAGEAALMDVERLRGALKAEGSRIRHLFDFVLGIAVRKVTPKRPRRKIVEVDFEEIEDPEEE